MNISDEQQRAIDELARVDESIVRSVLTRVPSSWELIESMESGAAFRRATLQVIFTVQKYEDHNIWLHVSVCGRRGQTSYYLPDFEDLKRVKNDFIGRNKWAYQVFPDDKMYVNQHPYVLHLFALLENRPALPDFTYGTGTI